MRVERYKNEFFKTICLRIGAFGVALHTGELNDLRFTLNTKKGLIQLTLGLWFIKFGRYPF